MNYHICKVYKDINKGSITYATFYYELDAKAYLNMLIQNTKNNDDFYWELFDMSIFYGLAEDTANKVIKPFLDKCQKEGLKVYE